MMAVAEEQLWFSSGERDGVEIAIFPISIAKPVGKTENRLVPPKGKELHQIPVLFQEAPGLSTGRVPDKNTVAQSLDIREAMTGIEDPAIFHGKACNLEGRRGEGGGYAGRRVVDIQLGPLPAGEAQAVGPEGNVLQHIIGAVLYSSRAEASSGGLRLSRFGRFMSTVAVKTNRPSVKRRALPARMGTVNRVCASPPSTGSA